MKVIKPNAKLQQVVKHYYVFDSNDFKPATKYFAVTNPFIKISDKSALLSGPAIYPAIVSLPGCNFGMAFSLHFGSAYKLFGVPLNLLLNQTLDLEDAVGSPMKELIERISLTVNLQDKMALLENYLLRFLDQNQRPDNFEIKCLEILMSGSSTSITCIADSLGVSSRQLQRLVNTYIGMSPNLLKRILRFEKAINLLQFTVDDISWVNIAYECGYSDQSHFIRDFKEFSGFTPSEYVHFLAMSDLSNPN